MKCLAISSSYPPDHAGGYELGACNLLESLARHCGWDNTVVAGVRNKKSPKTHALELTGFFPGKLGPGVAGMQTRQKLLRNQSRIVTQLNQLALDSDVVFIFNPRRLIYPQWVSALESDTPAFVFVSDHWTTDPMNADLFYLKSRNALPACYQDVPPAEGLLKKFRGALFGSRFLRQKLERDFPETVHRGVVHWGIDINQFPAVEFTPERLKTIGFCGRPDPAKGLDLALEAFRELAARDAELRLLIASGLKSTAYGRSALRQINRDAILKARVRLLGQVPHAELHRQFYRHVGLLLFPSVWEEPFSLTVLEAMASGCLVVGSHTGGTPEVLDDATGFLFDPGREGDLFDKARAALEAGQANAERVQAGIRRIHERHTLEQMTRQVDRFIRSCI